jgi:hypothetical protein
MAEILREEVEKLMKSQKVELKVRKTNETKQLNNLLP